jgi:hypothetical protein
MPIPNFTGSGMKKMALKRNRGRREGSEGY